MREIKFRGKAKNSDWKYGCLKLDQVTNRYSILMGYEDLGYEVEEDSIGQYTGLKDKNGVEIYEGDIVELDEEGRCLFGCKGKPTRKYQLVGFRDGAFMTGRNNIGSYKIMNTFLWILKEYITVAGNKFDNLELLEEEGK